MPPRRDGRPSRRLTAAVMERVFSEALGFGGGKPRRDVQQQEEEEEETKKLFRPRASACGRNRPAAPGGPPPPERPRHDDAVPHNKLRAATEDAIADLKDLRTALRDELAAAHREIQRLRAEVASATKALRLTSPAPSPSGREPIEKKMDAMESDPEPAPPPPKKKLAVRISKDLEGLLALAASEKVEAATKENAALVSDEEKKKAVSQQTSKPYHETPGTISPPSSRGGPLTEMRSREKDVPALASDAKGVADRRPAALAPSAAPSGPPLTTTNAMAMDLMDTAPETLKAALSAPLPDSEDESSTAPQPRGRSGKQKRRATAATSAVRSSPIEKRAKQDFAPDADGFVPARRTARRVQSSTTLPTAVANSFDALADAPDQLPRDPAPKKDCLASLSRRQRQGRPPPSRLRRLLLLLPHPRPCRHLRLLRLHHSC
ncbi:nucleolar and coiled-body phosphoprotein 1-like [Schistocerca americana]|uniref:nucleolar and coiled-body phosphoprotein 1-like n=1 Tax=Schistocerca americana TaxID=7009 RepID=UPI001F4FCCA8|nr:nucleolar and coiled-body phosphoprotein 1-like [Schistocerca americana]